MTKTSKRTAASPKRSPKRRPRRSRRVRTTASKRLLPHEAALVAFAVLARELELRWYVFGAQAVNLHGFPRATADLDLTIDPGERSPRTLVKALKRAGFIPRFSDDTFVATTRVIPVVHRASQLPIDLVLAGPGLEQQFLDEVEVHRVAGTDVPVLAVENLVVTKVLADRPRDHEDVREIVAARSTLDHAKIEELLALIEDALGHSDLRPRYARLRSEAKRRPSVIE